MAKLPDPMPSVRPSPQVALPPPGEVRPVDPEELEKIMADQRRSDEAVLKQLRSLRIIVSLGGLASLVVTGLVIFKLWNWHLAGWANLPELSAAGAIASTMIARLAFLNIGPNERLEGSYSPQHRLDMITHSIGVLLGAPLVLLAVGWFLKVLL